jgi:ATP-dependent RNA helicase RhlE
MSFQDFQLHPSLLQALAEIGFETPTPIQVQAIPAVMAGKDVLGSAQTGTGKTAAFMLPVLHELLMNPGRGLQVLVLEPTRELAVQVEEQAQLFGKHTALRSACVYGGVAMGPQEKALKEGYEIIAATPGRLLDHMRQGNVNALGLRVLVLDEVDRMLDMGFLPDVRSILRQLPAERQTLFFSATVPGEIQHLCDSLLKDPVRVAIAPDRKTAEGISQKIYPVAEHLKPVLLNRLLTDEGVTSALVFTRTKQGADKVCSVVERHSSGSAQVERIHGDRSQKERQQALTAFKEGKVKFLVATDIAARGIDIDGISHVINYDLPDSPEDYVHRIGRTARAGATGHAYSLMSSRESLLVSTIEQHLNMKLEKCMLEDFKYDEELGTQHEVRQGHDGIKHFDDKRPARPAREEFRPPADERPSPGTGIPIIRESDERATIIVRRKGAVEGLIAESSRSPENRGGRGGRDRGRGGRDRGGRPAKDFERPAEREARREFSTAQQTANSASPMSATDVLRRAGSQKAAVESTALELRPRGETRESAPVKQESGDAMFDRLTGGGNARESQVPRQPQGSPRDFQTSRPNQPVRETPSRPGQGSRDQSNSEGDGPRRRRRRGGRGRHGRDSMQEVNRDGRPPQRQDLRQNTRPQNESSKPSLLSKLKGLFGLGNKKPSNINYGDKW